LLRNAAWTYLGVYAAISLLDLREGVKRGHSLLRLLVESAIFALAAAGFVLLMVGFETPLLRNLWKVVAPVLVLASVGVSFIEVREVEQAPDPDFSPRENYWMVFVGSTLAVLLAVPVLLANLVYAFGS
jgi:hypothetical protein